VSDPASPERLTVTAAFQRHVGIDCWLAGSAEKLAHVSGIAMHVGDSWDDVFFRIMFERSSRTRHGPRSCVIPI
jgi:lysyl-tRNA synthetase class 2